MRTGAWRVWVVAISLVLLHFTLRVGLGYAGGVPDFLVIGLLLLARELGLGTAAAVGLGLGLCEDAYLDLSFGANGFALTILGALASRSREYFVGDSVLFLLGYIAAGIWLRHALHWLVAVAGREPAATFLLVDAPISALYGALVGLIIVVITGAWWESVR